MDDISLRAAIHKSGTLVNRMGKWLTVFPAAMKKWLSIEFDSGGKILFYSGMLLTVTFMPALPAGAQTASPPATSTSSLALTSGIPGSGVIALLLPDGLDATNPGVMAWLDAARETGLRIETLTDTQFLSLGSGVNAYKGLILPDGFHVTAPDGLVSAIQNYVTSGGQAMLVYDFGALTSAGAYAIPRSRFSNLAGVDYLLYDELRDRTTGLGPITGFESKFRQIQVPPGKSVLFASSATSPAISAARTSEAPQMTVTSAKVVAIETGALKGANLAPDQALYLPVSTKNPGGVIGYDHAQQFKPDPIDVHTLLRTSSGPIASKTTTTTAPGSALKPLGSQTPAKAVVAPPLSFNSAKKLPLVNDTTPLSTATSGSSTRLLPSAAVTAAVTDSVQAISGYVYGALTYPSFVTRGTFAGTQIANSPQFGLVAGVNSVGSGKVLFVNVPLTYLKGGTDGMLMHGFLSYFAKDMLNMPRLSTVPNARAGLTLNWHLCSNFTADMTQLDQQGVFNYGPFSIHITAGPDTIAIGDRLGWDLPTNIAAQAMLRNLQALGHRIGNHGGWIHDYYGENASETNQSTFQQYLDLNKNAVDAVMGRPSVEYAAPQGNSPSWAMNWLEQNGIVGTYYLGHTGLGPTRNYIDGEFKNPKLWINPVMPFGMYATFEEFIEYGVPKQGVTDWYKQLIDFSVQNRTNRLIYMHPPGAANWSDVVLGMLVYAKTQSQAGKFTWYTIADIDNFMTSRNKVTWNETVGNAGIRKYTATHPANLATMSWIFPKAGFAKPSVTAGNATVSDGGDSWLVVAKGGKTLNFTAMPI